jgi:hypothetical protein
MRILTDSGRVKNAVSGYDTTLKARRCGIVLKGQEALFLIWHCHVPDDE